MTPTDFDPVARTLREVLIDFYRREEDRRHSIFAWHNTLETNSGFVERRTAPLLEMLEQRTGRASLDGLDVLDVGCGFGAMSVFLASQGAIVTGIDPNRRRLKVGRTVAERHGLAARFLPGTMQHLPFEDHSFDIAVQNNSFCYVEATDDRARALAEMRRVLRPGGYLLSRDPNRWSPVDPFTGLPLISLAPPRAANLMAVMLGRRRSNVRLTSPRGARRQLAEAGFVDIEHAASPASRWPASTKVVSRYHHFLARRPAADSGGMPLHAETPVTQSST